MKRRDRVMRAAIFAAIAATTLAVAATGCSSSDKSGSSGAAGALKDSTGAEWIVSTNPDTGAVTFATPKNGPFTVPGASAALDQTVLAFLDKHKAIFKMHDPKAELVFVRTERSGSNTDVRFAQKVGNVAVHGGVWIAHFDGTGRLTSMNGNYAVGAHTVSTTPALAVADAETAAKAEATKRKATLPASALATTVNGLEILEVKGAPPVLVHVVKVKSTQVGTPLSITVYVDATSGAVRLVTEGIQRASATALPPESYPPFNITGSPALTFPVSEDDPPQLRAATTSGVVVAVVSQARPELGFIPAVATSPYWADILEPRAVGPAAQSYANFVVEYFAEHEKNGAPWKSYDGTGADLISVVNDNGEGVAQAYWDPDSNTMHYGDGEVSNLEWPTSASFDTVAHEIMHGVTQYVSGLEYVNGQDNGGLNESLSDIFAALITHRVRNDDAKDFTFSEDDNNARVPFRSMIQPTLSTLREGGGPSELSALSSGKGRESHADSNISSHAFYLMTHGGTHETTRYKVPCGIGWAAADKVMWRTVSGFVQPTETFRQFALHTLAVAREQQVNDRPVACAWVAVGVLTEDEAKNDWNAICEKDQDGGAADAGDGGDNFLVETVPQLVECSQSLGGGGGPLTGGGTSLTE